MTASTSDHLPQSARDRRQPTIHDVAHDADVSRTSISRYFGHECALLSDAMIERIETPVERLGFHPDRLASSLRGRRIGLIGMVVADMRHPYTIAMLHVAEFACRKHGYSLLICNTDNDDQLKRRHLEVLCGYSVEGLVGPEITTVAQPVSNIGYSAIDTLMDAPGHVQTTTLSAQLYLRGSTTLKGT